MKQKTNTTQPTIRNARSALKLVPNSHDAHPLTESIQTKSSRTTVLDIIFADNSSFKTDDEKSTAQRAVESALERCEGDPNSQRHIIKILETKNKQENTIEQQITAYRGG